MNAHLQKLTAGMNNSKPSEVAKAPTNEESSDARQLGNAGKPNIVTDSDERSPSESQPGDKNRAAIDRCMRTGEVMRVLFPEGLQLKAEQEFAVFRLFDGLVGNVAQFAQTGMTQQAALRAITSHATLLEEVISSSDRP